MSAEIQWYETQWNRKFYRKRDGLKQHYGGRSAAAKSLQSCPTLCDPIDGSPPGSPIPGILQERTLEWVSISFPNAWKWKVKVKTLSRVRLFATPWTAAHQAPPSMGFSRQEYWSRVPLSSPMERGVEARLSTLHWSLTIYLTWCCCCIQRSNNDWKVFIAFGNYLIQILCGPLVLICRAVIHIICQYQSAPFNYPWQIYAITHFKSLQPLWTRFCKWSEEC